MARRTLNQTQSLTNNIFHHFTNPIWGSSPTATILGTQYIGNHSGQKITAPLVNMMLQNNEDEDDPNLLTDEQLDTLCEIIDAMFRNNWQRLWDVYIKEYDALSPYSITETKEGTNNVLQTPNNWTTTSSGTASTTSNASGTSKNQIYGFDSENPSDANATTGSNSGSGTTTNSGSSTLTGTYATDSDYDYTLTRKGNIGNTLNQEMLEAELRLWRWKFFDQVFSDIDSVLTIDYYNYGGEE